MCHILFGALLAIGVLKFGRHAFRGRGCGHHRAFSWGMSGGPGHWGRGWGDCGSGGCGPADRADYGEAGGEGEDLRDEHVRRGGGFAERYALRWLYQRLDTTPGQEKVIREAFEEISEALGKAKGDLHGSFGELAKAVRGAEFDHAAVSEAWVRHDGAFEASRLAISSALQRVHEALDERQRAILADLIESGPRAFRGGFRRGRWA